MVQSATPFKYHTVMLETTCLESRQQFTDHNSLFTGQIFNVFHPAYKLMD